jgi:D-alanine-D-alanine ligase
MALRVLHLAGSATSEHLDALSRLYAGDCLETVADPQRYEPLIAHVGPDRRWRFPAGLGATELGAVIAVDLPEAVARLLAFAPDVAVPQMFCLPGMTDYRALLDLLGIPFLGNRAAAMALAAQKDQARAVAAAAGVLVPEGQTVTAGERVWIDPPAVVKPVDADNSIGMRLVGERSEFPAAIAEACEHGTAALVERFVPPGREVRCGIVVRDGELLPLPLEEYPVDRERPVRTAADKLRRDADGQLHLVAKGGERAWAVDVEDPVTAAVWAAATRCHRAFGCRHYSLFDFRVDPAGRPWFLEASLYCSFARQSVIATMAAGAGIEPPELFAAVIDEALGERIAA